jgi:hypothetical protein
VKFFERRPSVGSPEKAKELDDNIAVPGEYASGKICTFAVRAHFAFSTGDQHAEGVVG